MKDIERDLERFNIDPEEKFLLWIMKEKNNLNSEFQYYFQNLPQFKTGILLAPRKCSNHILNYGCSLKL